MTLLPFAHRNVQIAIEDLRQRVASICSALDAVRTYQREDDYVVQRRLGYNEGWRNGLLIGIGLSCGAGVVVYLLMLVVAS